MNLLSRIILQTYRLFNSQPQITSPQREPDHTEYAPPYATSPYWRGRIGGQPPMAWCAKPLTRRTMNMHGPGSRGHRSAGRKRV